jgi:YD repeat-containing protein
LHAPKRRPPSPWKGLLQHTIDTSESLAAKQLKRSLTYDGFGNVKTITLDSADGTAADRQTEFFYNAPGHLGHLPSSISRYISGEPAHTESFTWNYHLTLPLTHTAAVGVPATQWSYDDLGRLSRETRSDGTFTDFVLNMDYVGQMQNSIPARVLSGSDGSATWEYFDSYGRVVGGETRLNDNWNWSVQRFFYDEAGNLDKETQPFIWGEPEYQVDYAHDLLGAARKRTDRSARPSLRVRSRRSPTPGSRRRSQPPAIPATRRPSLCAMRSAATSRSRPGLEATPPTAAARAARTPSRASPACSRTPTPTT